MTDGIEKYQRLFNAIASTNGTALQSEMDEIISIVHKDFPSSLPTVSGEDGIRMAEAYANEHSYQSDKVQFTTTPWTEWNIYYNAFLAGYAAHPPSEGNNWIKIEEGKK